MIVVSAEEETGLDALYNVGAESISALGNAVERQGALLVQERRSHAWCSESGTCSEFAREVSV